MEVKNIVIHTLDKQQGGNAILKKAARELIPTTFHEEFMDEVRNVYYKKSNPIYGVFNSSQVSFPYQTFLDSYLKGSTEFYQFTVLAMEHFLVEINKSSQATGGYVLFCHFTTTEEFMAVIMLNNKNGYIVDEHQDIKRNARLDIETLDVANFTNCDKWNAGEDIYLSFTKGKKEVSNYFKQFIGCTDFTSAKEASANMMRALSDYFLQSGLSDKEVEATKSTIFAYCEQRMRGKEDISLEFVSGLVDHDNPSLFKEFASSETYQVSPLFKGHNLTLRSLKYYYYKSKQLVIVFDSQMLDQTIFYNVKKNELLIKNIPVNLQLQLNKQLPSSNVNE